MSERSCRILAWNIYLKQASLATCPGGTYMFLNPTHVLQDPPPEVLLVTRSSVPRDRE